MGCTVHYHVDVTCRVFPHRYYVCILCWLGLTISYVMRFFLSFALTEMVEPPEKKYDPNACEPLEPSLESGEPTGKLKWTNLEQGIVLSSFFWGYIITQVPAGHLADVIGPRRVIFYGVLATSGLTAITPVLLFHGGMAGIIGIRVVIGLVQGCFYASLHTVVALWVPLQERGLWGTLVFTGSQSGNFVTALSSGFLLDVLRPNWHYLFYIWGAIGGLWSAVFFFTTYENFLKVPKITEKEVAIMTQYFEDVSKKETIRFAPWKFIFKSIPVWAIIIAQVGHDFVFYMIVINVPLYMNQVLLFNVVENGLYVSMGWLFLFFFALGCGKLVDVIDRKKLLSRTWNRKLFTAIASLGPSIGMLGTSYAHCERLWAIVSMVLGIAAIGTFYSSLKINPIDLAPNHAGTLGALGNGIGTLSGVIAPWVVGAMTPNATWLEWNYVWWLNIIIVSLGVTFYMSTASGEIQPWNTEGIGRQSSLIQLDKK